MQIRQYSCYESLTEVLAFQWPSTIFSVFERTVQASNERERDTHTEAHTEREREGEIYMYIKLN